MINVADSEDNCSIFSIFLAQDKTLISGNIFIIKIKIKHL